LLVKTVFFTNTRRSHNTIQWWVGVHCSGRKRCITVAAYI